MRTGGMRFLAQVRALVAITTARPLFRGAAVGIWYTVVAIRPPGSGRPRHLDRGSCDEIMFTALLRDVGTE